MRMYGIWFNDDHLKKVKKHDFIKNHKHLNLTEDQLSTVWESKNPIKKDQKDSKVESPES